MTVNSRRARLERERQLKIRIAVMIGIMITMILCLVFTIRAFAGTNSGEEVNAISKQYKSIMIYCNDTVESVAADNITCGYSSVERMADEIRSINHLSPDDHLIPGNYLVIPYYSNI